ncbi:MAG: hypothetical protein ACRDD1_21635, partial [Planctomycetia bacterium]
EAPPGAPIPKTFAFGSPTAEETQMVYQRYRDADLVAVGETVDLEESYEKRSYTLLGLMAAGGAAVVGLFGLVLRSVLKRPAAARPTIQMPAQLTPFTVIGLLQSLRTRPTFDAGERAAIDASIQSIERHFFAEANGVGPVDLKSIAERWVSAAEAKK